MNFFCDSGGKIFHVDSENVYQGSVNANKIYFIGAFPSFCNVTARFQLPNGVYTEPQLLTKVSQDTLTDIQGINGENFNVWYCLLDKIITQYYGTASVQFNVIGTENIVLATANSSFEILRGVPTEIDTSDIKTFTDQVLSYIASVDNIVKEYDETIINSKEEFNEFLNTIENAKEEINEVVSSLEGVDEKLGDYYTKEETDGGFVEKATNAPGGYFIYGTTYQGTDTKLFNSFFSTTEYGCLAMYGPNGVLRATKPTSDTDCANKKYVDDTCKLYRHHLNITDKNSNSTFMFDVLSSSDVPFSNGGDIYGYFLNYANQAIVASYSSGTGSGVATLRFGEVGIDRTTYHAILMDFNSGTGIVFEGGSFGMGEFEWTDTVREI